ncbi:hypothetical protein [Flavobacterium daemonense]|uniref:hypothetical protein n=1 Tax=Flavobacterium daemonense TaxID=1393049 RepID=UPI001185ED1B|nr:hypothetical protein [Flavobacterium daemonense]KAF2329077.1 hypothetical protein FND99_17260 [Flavobacterium daemonense]
MFNLIKKNIYKSKYNMHPEAIIISCFFNPQNSPYRIKAFNIFYESIKHLDHTIIECIIGDTHPQLDQNDNIKRVYTENLLWHKESLLNKIISELPKKYKYVFWLDADVVFTNTNWIIDGVKQLESKTIIQPFEYCVFLEKDEVKPSFDMEKIRDSYLPNAINTKVWRSFGANYTDTELWKNEKLNIHGHVGFAWGARRDILDAVPLFDKALIGGADNIIAHAAAGQIPHSSIAKTFIEDIDQINLWSKNFHKATEGKIGYVEGDLYHIWHGDLGKRQYIQRYQYNSKAKEIINRDENGLYITNRSDDPFIKNYFKQKEVQKKEKSNFFNNFFLRVNKTK